MRNRDIVFLPLAITNPNKVWVVENFENLLNEWKVWNVYVQTLPNEQDSPDYVAGSCADCIKDGRINLDKHQILREKTLVFLRNNFSGYEFILKDWKSHPHEHTLDRLYKRVPRWIYNLEMLQASLPYAHVPEGFWKQKGKDLVDLITSTLPEKAVDIAASYLKNPLQ